MFFQKVIKGIPGLSRDDADGTLIHGIICNWWRRVHHIAPREVLAKLNDRNLDWHLNHYADHDPMEGMPFCDNTPFISTTAGVVERERFLRTNVVYDPLITALWFATDGFTKTGHIFHAYLFTLGRKSVELKEFAEEVRELNVYTGYLPYHAEGEITAKIEIRAPQIERWEEYHGPSAESQIMAGGVARPVAIGVNSLYAPPERFCNIRGLVTV